MSRSTLTVEIPSALNLSPEELQLFLAAKLYEAGHLSMGHCAQMVGMSKREFMLSIGQVGVSVFNQSPEELEEDLRNA